MAQSQLESAVPALLLVVLCAGGFALLRESSHAAGKRAATNTGTKGPAELPQEQLPALSEPPPASEPPIKLGSISVAEVRDYFGATGYTFDEQLTGNIARVVARWPHGQTTIELAGHPTLERASLHYALQAGNLGGQDVAAIMYLMQQVKAGEIDVSWALDAARKGEPTQRTIGAVVYAIQRGPNGTNEFVMQRAPGFE